MATERRDDTPATIDVTDLEGDRDYAVTGRQRSPRTDPSMRDGDSGRGNPHEYDPGDAEPGTDADVGWPDERPAHPVRRKGFVLYRSYRVAPAPTVSGWWAWPVRWSQASLTAALASCQPSFDLPLALSQPLCRSPSTSS